MQRIREGGWPSPCGASLVGPEKLPAEAFEQAALDAILAEA